MSLINDVHQLARTTSILRSGAKPDADPAEAVAAEADVAAVTEAFCASMAVLCPSGRTSYLDATVVLPFSAKKLLIA